MSDPIPIPNAALIRAVLDGKVVQYENETCNNWVDFKAGPAETIRTLLDYPSRKVRLKPKTIVRWLGVFRSSNKIATTLFLSEGAARDIASAFGGTVTPIEIDEIMLTATVHETEAP